MGGPSARLAAKRLIRLVELIMPDERQEWARAMRAEAASVESEAATLRFAAGCLWAACHERSTAEIRKGAALLPAGLTIGAAFCAHAAVNGSRAWPFMWPLLGGILAVASSARRGSCLGFGSGAGLGLRTGAIAGLLFAGAGAIVVALSDRVTLTSRLPVLAVSALSGAVLSAMGGGATALLGRSRR